MLGIPAIQPPRKTSMVEFIEEAPDPELAQHSDAPQDALHYLLTSINLGHLLPRFIEQEVSVTILNQLSDKELEKLGVATVGMRYKLRQAVNEALREAESIGVLDTHLPAANLRSMLAVASIKSGRVNGEPARRAKVPIQRAINLRLERLDKDGNGRYSAAEILENADDIHALVSAILDFWTSIGTVSALLLTITVPTIMQGSLDQARARRGSNPTCPKPGLPATMA